MPTRIKIELQEQRLDLYRDEKLQSSYPISSAINGPGEKLGSGCTPLGEHLIRIKIGEGEPENAVFEARRPTGEIYTPELGEAFPERDWILTRILWLSGKESGFNRGGDRDSLRRFIYIHGCPDSEPMGEPRSHGCIRMRNSDLLELFDRVETGTSVEILE
jgi:lipoprotein-anchoring transpeptidase ErfK/SrfK